MASKKKLLQAAAGSAGGATLDVDEVFSTTLRTSDGTTAAINNGIDLSGEGGLVWTKNRGASAWHVLTDTERGGANTLSSNVTNGQLSGSIGGTVTFNNNGYSIASGYAENNANTRTYVDWTWRKAPKFFDVVTYSGNGTAGRTVSHNLGSVPGMFIVKEYGASGENWSVYHRGLGATKTISLNHTNQASSSINHWNNTAPTDSVFTLGDEAGVNGNGKSFVAYLFAHHNNDGEFGPDSDADIIKCGSYTGTGASGNKINLGFEPQWLLIKDSNDSNSWVITDTMRGLTSSTAAGLFANVSNAEFNSSGYAAALHADGFTPTGSNGNNTTYIYMAIRRGPLAAPDDATKVFSIDSIGSSAPYFDSNHIVDMGLVKLTTASSSWFVYTRLAGEKNFYTDFTAAENNASEAGFDFMNGHIDALWGDPNAHSWMWKRAPSFFDVVAYTGTGSARTVAHNLGAVPEMMWVKRRDGANNWSVYHSGVDTSSPQNYELRLNSTTARVDEDNRWNDTAPTSSVFTVGTSVVTNTSGGTYIAYLFATVAGVSKVGSYTGNGSDGKQIDCGFSSGARFVLIKNTTVSNTNWLVFDTVRGIVAGNDARLYLNTTDSQNSGTDYVDPYSSGFALTANAQVNYSGSTYIFYAIA